MKKFSGKLVWQSLKAAASGFANDKVTKLSASLAYYTVFSLPPLLVVIISVSSIFLGREAIQGTIDNQIQQFIGADAAKQIQDMIRNAAISGKGVMAIVIGVLTLLIGATTVFAELQDSMNSIWGLKPRPKAGLMKTIQTRLLSFGLIGSLVFLLLVSLAATTLIEGIGGQLKRFLPDAAVVLFYILNLVITLAATTMLFAVVFKVLPDAKIKWKDILPGAIATSLLFVIGKFAISLYVSKSEIGSTYGAAGSLVVLLVWIYYSSIILYFGAEFTKQYAVHTGARIIPNHYAEWNAKPAVPGARPVQPHAVNRQQLRKEPQKNPRLTSAASFASPLPGQQRQKAGPGMGTVLMGLALYLFNTSGKKQ
jgi:membrane protein